MEYLLATAAGALWVFALIGVHIHFNRLKKCNDTTHQHRSKMIDAIYAHANYKRLSSLFNMVEYQDHMDALVKRRNPFELYDRELIDACSAYELAKADKEAVQ